MLVIFNQIHCVLTLPTFCYITTWVMGVMGSNFGNGGICKPHF